MSRVRIPLATPAASGTPPCGQGCRHVTARSSPPCPPVWPRSCPHCGRPPASPLAGIAPMGHGRSLGAGHALAPCLWPATAGVDLLPPGWAVPASVGRDCRSGSRRRSRRWTTSGASPEAVSPETVERTTDLEGPDAVRPPRRRGREGSRTHQVSAANPAPPRPRRRFRLWHHLLGERRGRPCSGGWVLRATSRDWSNPGVTRRRAAIRPFIG